MALSQDLEILQAEGRLKSRSAELCISVIIILLCCRNVPTATCAERDGLASEYTVRELSCAGYLSNLFLNLYVHFIPITSFKCTRARNLLLNKWILKFYN